MCRPYMLGLVVICKILKDFFAKCPKTKVNDTHPCCSREARREERRGGDFNHCDIPWYIQLRNATTDDGNKCNEPNEYLSINKIHDPEP